MKQPAITQETGVIAIFLSVIIGILLLTSTTFAARVSTSELNQSSQVDQSEAAYYAAEAGVEEAIRRLVTNPGATVCQAFPEQFGLGLGTIQSGTCPAASSQVGDYAILNNGINPGATEGTNLAVVTEPTAATASMGGVAWRYRKVTAEGDSFTGTQVKDESVQFDTSELCRHMSTGVYGTTACNPGPGHAIGYDPLGNPNPSNPISNSLRGLQYCWTAQPGQAPAIEFTDVYWSNINQIQTEKYIVGNPYVGANPVFASGLGLTVTTGAGATPAQPAYGYCVQLDTTRPAAPNTKFIFRFKPLYPGVTGTAQVQNASSITYHVALDDSANGYLSGNPLYLPSNVFLVDVVGESGDIKRRVVAKVSRNGGILGIFDYLVYSGASGSDLCKPGITQLEGSYNTSVCSPYNVIN